MNLAKHILEQVIINDNPEQICYRGRKIPGDQIVTNSICLAEKLRDRHFMPDQRVLLIMKDNPSFIYSFIALMAIGCIPVPLNPKIEENILNHILHDSRAAGVIIDLKEYDGLRQVLLSSPYLNNNNHIINDLYEDDDIPVQSNCIRHLLATHSNSCDFKFYEKKPISSSFWQYTSGTTGMPKAIQHSQEVMLLNTNNFAIDTLDISKVDRIMSVPKMFFGYGLGNSFFFPLITGASVLLDSQWPTIERILYNIETFRPTIFFGVAKTYSLFLQQKKKATYFDMNCIRLFFSAGSILPVGINEEWKVWQGKHIVNGIGSTEIGHVFICNKPGSVVPEISGWPVNGYRLRIADPADPQKEMPVGMPGELCIQAPYALSKYWENYVSNDEHFKQNWYYSGDLCVATADGGYVFRGRKDDLFKIKGRWVNPLEVEILVLQLFNIDECVLVEVEDDKGLSAAMLFIVKRDDQLVEEEVIKNTLPRYLNSYKCPEVVYSIDQLPKNANGKVNRKGIKRLYDTRFREPV
jgi:anthranilate-CoA ligase